MRGYEDACAVESHSNDISPTIKTIAGFTVIVELDEEKDYRQEYSDSQHDADR